MAKKFVIRTDHAPAPLAGAPYSQAILTAANSRLDYLVKTTVFLARMEDFAEMNEVYARHAGKQSPARSTIQAAKQRLEEQARAAAEAERQRRQEAKDVAVGTAGEYDKTLRVREAGDAFRQRRSVTGADRAHGEHFPEK